jgi:O-antigen/teichoic acid export membrane protein
MDVFKINNGSKILNKVFFSKSRSAIAKRNSFYMLLIKGFSVLINLAFVPLLIDVLNTERYGIWLTVTTITGWLSFFDVGLGHGLRNNLSESIAKKDYILARKYVSTSYISLFFIVIVLLLLNLFITPLINWSNVLNAPPSMNLELTALVYWVVFLFFLQFFFKLITSVLFALQKPAFSSLLITLGQVLAFFIIFLLKYKYSYLTLKELGIIISVTPLFVFVFVSIVLYMWKYRIYRPTLSGFDKKLIMPIFSLSSKFFLVQITALFLFQTDNIIIAHVCGSKEVTEFNLAFKYIGVINMVFSILTIPYWSATTDAYANKDFDWIKNTINTLNKYWFLMFFFGIILFFSSEFLYDLWLGKRLKPDNILLLLVFIYYSFYMRWTLYGSIINGIGKIKLQFYITVLTVFIHIPLAIILGNSLGIYGVVISMIVVGIINSIWPPLQIKRLLNGASTGIWSK